MKALCPGRPRALQGAKNAVWQPTQLPPVILRIPQTLKHTSISVILIISIWYLSSTVPQKVRTINIYKRSLYSEILMVAKHLEWLTPTSRLFWFRLALSAEKYDAECLSPWTGETFVRFGAKYPRRCFLAPPPLSLVMCAYTHFCFLVSRVVTLDGGLRVVHQLILARPVISFHTFYSNYKA